MLLFGLGCAFAPVAGAEDVAASPSASADVSGEGASTSAPEKLFYKVSLNESVFIQDREATVNARATVEILQGELDKVTLEVFGVGSGQGEVFNVSGEKVKDWSLRRENARTFLEIRPKDLGAEKSFTMTISGRQPLKLPTTISPMLFSGVDSAAFLGVVQFLANADLRLYAKQERGLIPLGERSRSEINYGIMGRPSLRLDIARANELLAPASLEQFSLVGDVEAAGARFRMKAKAQVREAGAEIPVLTGNAALLDFPKKNNFIVLAEKDENGLARYSLRFPTRGTFDVDLQFDAGIVDADGWQRLNFSVPAAQVAPYSLVGMPNDTVFAADNVSIPQRDGNETFSGFLPSSGALDLRWRPSILTPPEFSSASYAVDVVSELRIQTGILVQKTELTFNISQGELPSLFLDVFGNGEILSVEGQDVLSWRKVTTANGRRGLNVQLSQPKTGAYVLRIVSQTRSGTFPRTISPLRFSPARTDWEDLPLSAVCVRNNEFLRVRNGVGIRGEAVPQAGMTQVVADAFPQESDFFEKDVPAEEVAVYRLSSDTEKFRIKADVVRADLIVNPRVRWFFDDGKITSAQSFEFEVRDAPLYEMQILIPDDLEMTSLDSELLAGHEWTDGPSVAGYRLLTLVFSEPFLGTGRVLLTFRKKGEELGKETELRACLFPQAHFVYGVMGLSAQRHLRVLPVSAENLTQIDPEEYGSNVPPQEAFRVRDAAWKIALRVEERSPVLCGESSCVYRISSEKITGDFRVDYTSGGVPVSQVKLAFPQGAKVLSLSGKNVRDWTVDPDGTACVYFDSDPGENFSVNAIFEEVRKDGEKHNFEGVKLLGVLGDTGTILLTANRVVSFAGEESVLPLAVIPASEVSEDYAQRGGSILFRAYQFVERPFTLSLDAHLPRSEKMPDVVVTDAKIVSSSDALGYDAVYRYYAFGATDLRIAVPAEMKVICDGARVQDDGTVLLPLSPKASEIRFRVVPKNPEEPRGRAVTFLLPQVFAPVLRTEFSGIGEVSSKTMTVDVSGRHLNDTLSAAFFGRFFALFWSGRFVAVPALLVLAGALFFSRIVRRRKISFLLWITAMLAGTVFAGAFVWWLVETVRPEYGTAVLTAGFTEPGAQLEVSLQRFYFLTSDLVPSPAVAKFVLGVFFVGVFLLLCGATATRWRHGLRIVGRVLLYGAAASFSFEDFPHRLSALIVLVFAVEASVFLLRSVSRGIERIRTTWTAKFSGNAMMLLAAMLLLPFAFPSVEARASTGFNFSGWEETKEVPHDVADRITQAIDIRDDRIVSRGDIRVSGFAGDRFDLLASPAVLTSFEKVENAMLRLERRAAEGAGFVYQVVLERAGTFSATFSYEYALAENARGFPILTGAAAADVATVNMPRSEVVISAKGAVTTSFTPYGESAQIAQIVFMPKTEREVRWNPRERDRAREALRVFASSENLYVPSAGLVEGFHVLKFVPAQGEMRSVKIRIPKPFSVSRIEGPAIHRWNFNRETGILNVLFTAPRVSDFALSIFTQGQLNLLPTKQTFAAPEAIGCDVQVQTIGVATDDALQVDSVNAGSLVAIDENEFGEILSAAGISVKAPLRLRRVFRTVNGGGEFEAELSAVKPNLRINNEEMFFVNGDFVRAEIKLNASVSRAELFNIAFDIPAGVDIDAIHGNELSYWTKKPLPSGGARVTLHLKNALSGEQDFEIQLSGVFPKDAEEWILPGIDVVNAKTQRGNISVSVDKGLRLKPSSYGSTTIRETEITENNNTFKFRYFSRSGGGPKFDVLESKPFTNANWLHTITPIGRYAFSRVDLRWGIENVTRSSLRLKLPEDALSVRFFCDELVSAEKVDGDVSGLWELKFSEPLRGNVSVVAEFFTPIPLDQKLRVSPISVPDADLSSAWLAVDRGKIFTELKTHSPEQVSVADIPTEFNFKAEDRAWFVERYAEKYSATLLIAPEAISAWKESLTDVRSDSFSAGTLNRYTVFDKKSALMEEQISLVATRSDVLRILLPEDATLKFIAQDGVSSRVICQEGENVVWLPIFSRGDSPTEISVLYEQPLKEILSKEHYSAEIVPAEIVFADKVTWSLLSPDDSASVVSVFGRSPDALAESLGGNARLLTAYSDKPEGWQTFSGSGNADARQGAICVFRKTEPEDDGSDFEYFLLGLVAIVALKVVIKRRKHKAKS